MAVDQTAIDRLELSPAENQGQGRPAQSYWSESWERLRAHRFGMFFGGLLLLLGLIAVLAPVFSDQVTHWDPARQDLDHVFAAPGGEHWLGTDELGRDTLTRLIWGARVSLGVGFLTVAIYIVLGGTIGVVAGYYGGLVDDLLMRFVDVLLSIPTIYLLILVTSLLPLPVGPFHIQHDVTSLSVIIALTVWGGVARLVRGEVLSVKVRDFMLATRSLGASDARLMFFHLVPNVLPVMIVAGSLGVGQIIVTEAALDFIGLGVQPPTASWGNMLLNSYTYFSHSVYLVAFPGFAIVLAVLAANIFGNSVRDAFDPRLR